MSIARYWRRSGGLITGISFLATLLLAGCGGGSGGDTSGKGPTAAVKITGTAAKGAPITSATVALKDKSGTTATGTTGADGKFTIDAKLTLPLLLRISTGNGYLYSVATAEGTTNIHPYTDLIIKNWYRAQGSNVETEFNSAGALTHIPTASEINTIEAVISSILSANMSNAGVAVGFNLITGTFAANSTGFDKVLDSTQVVIDTTTGGVTVTATDATTGITGTIVSTIAPIVTTADTTKPNDPTGLVALPASTSSIVLTWVASTDNVGVAGYNIYRGGNLLTTSPYPVYTDTSLSSGTNYCYQVEAFDGAGNKSAAKSTQACATVPSTADTTAPSTPTGLSATAASSSKINLSWSAATDNVGVIGYAVSRNGVQVTTVTGTSFSDVGLAAGTTYTYTVRAVDSSMNTSSASTSSSATTSAGLPTAPTGIAAAAADGQTSVTWNAVSSATSYNLYWSTSTGVSKSSGTKITGVTSPYAHTGRTNGTTYYYVVTAVNASGESVESAQVSTTPSSGGGGSSPAGPNSASGTYTWNAGTGTLTMTTTTSNFVCSGPKMGNESPATGITITSTTMTWLLPDSTTWTRSVSGAANDIVGVWTETSQNGTPFMLIFNANGTYSGSGTDNCAEVWSQYGQGRYGAGLEYRDPSATAVSVAGPGITGSVALTYNASYSSWGGVNSQSYQVDLGSTFPTGLPYTYTFTVTTASGTTTKTNTLTCFQQELVSIIAPIGTVTGAITFTWTGITDPVATYGVWLQDPNSGVNAALWNSYGLTGTSNVYGGPALTPGTTYNYSVQATGSTCSSGTSSVVSSFTYQ